MERLRPGPFEVDIILIQCTRRKGPVLIGCDTPTHRFTLTVSKRRDPVWSHFAIREELHLYVEEHLQRIRLAEIDSEELMDQLEDSVCRLVWSSTADSWYLPISFPMRQDWVLPSSLLVMWSIRDLTLVLGTDEDGLRSWIQEMSRGICIGVTVPWQ